MIHQGSPRSHLVDQLLGLLESHSEQKDDVVDPRNDAVGLVPVELAAAGLGVWDDVVDGEHELAVLQVEAHGQLWGQRGDEAPLKQGHRASFTARFEPHENSSVKDLTHG